MHGRDLAPLARVLRHRLARGPMPVAEWMAACNAHYYATRDPLGRDFTTAPEISQVFGELIGLWLADLWLRAGSPAPVRLVELGPGRGTLMADLWRATAKVPGFHAAATVHLVESSPVLRSGQAKRVPQAMWHDRLEDVPDDAPLLLIANEFFDALPVRQFVRHEGGWRERMVEADGEGVRFTISPKETPSPARAQWRESPLPQAGEGRRDADLPLSRVRERRLGAAERVRVSPTAILETSPASTAIAAEIGARLARHGGAALIVDYGYAGPAFGDTLQAVRGHAYADPLADPGEADLTAHVDFTALADAAGVAAHGPIDQGALLTALGIAARTEILAKSSTPEQAALLRSGAERLTGPDAMGSLFKALALTGPEWPTPAAFP